MKKLLALISILLFLAIPLTYAFAAEIDQVKAAIVKKGASWVAEENEISALPPAERIKRLGALPFKGLPPGHKTLTSAEIPENMKILPPAGTPVGTLLPTYWDWRSSCYDYSATYPKLKGCCMPGLGSDVPPVCGNFVTKVKDQKSCGSCWAFSVTGALESQFLIKFLAPGKSMDLSEQILVSCGADGTDGYGCGGGFTTDAAQFLHDQGTGKESCYPYKAKDESWGYTCDKACVNWHFLPYQLNSSDYGAFTPASATDLKSAIQSYGPVSVTFNVHYDFYFYKKGVYSYSGYPDLPYCHATAPYCGGHAVLAVGYQDDITAPGGGYFIVKNSWGSGWGMKGFFNIAYSELADTCQFGGTTVFYYGVNPVTLRITSPDKGNEVCHYGNSCSVVFDVPPFNTYTFAVYYKVGSGKWTLIGLPFDSTGVGQLERSFPAPAVTKATKAYFQVIQYYPADTTKVAAKVTSPVFLIEP
ncbi:MAG: C1 family peptidase [Smithellaceae bacterium]|jgi:hypothetical protein